MRKGDVTARIDGFNAVQGLQSVGWTAANGLATSHISFLFSKLSAPVFGDSTLLLSSIGHGAAVVAVSVLLWSFSHEVASTTFRKPHLRLTIATLWLDLNLVFSHSLLFPISERLGPNWGPKIVQLVAIPLLISLLSDGSSIKSDAARRVTATDALTGFLWPLLLCGAYLLSLWLTWWRYLPLVLTTYNPCGAISVYQGIYALSSCVASLGFSQRGGRSLEGKLIRCLLPAAALLFLHRAILPAQCKESLPTSFLARVPADMRILGRHFSSTGLVSIVEHRLGDRWVRVLRCDHSILGGVWLDPAITNMSEAEAIYTTFHVQEAVRLFLPPRLDHRALVIGLGVGTVVNGLETHGVQTTAIEIDPTVAKFAQQGFHMVKPSGGIKVADARSILLHSKLSAQSFDFVIHDVFTGGAVPRDLFQEQIWTAVRKVLKVNGVVAINFAGDLRSARGRHALREVQQSFSNCRAFGNTNIEKTWQTNLVIFCSMQPLNLRPASQGDYLGSYQREQALSQLEQREYDLNEAPKVLVDGTRSLLEDEIRERHQHWHIMRQVLKSHVWELF